MSDGKNPDRDTLDAMIKRGPYHQWLGLTITEVGEGEITIEVPWRDEFVVNPDGGYIHGGILAALVDLTADWAIATRLGRPYPTIDMRVDYHRPATKTRLKAKGRIVRIGSTFTTSEATVEDEDGKLLASGRGTYFTNTKP
jgi:uncharacterized protein (TIGR00369 family)